MDKRYATNNNKEEEPDEDQIEAEAEADTERDGKDKNKRGNSKRSQNLRRTMTQVNKRNAMMRASHMHGTSQRLRRKNNANVNRESHDGERRNMNSEREMRDKFAIEEAARSSLLATLRPRSSVHSPQQIDGMIDNEDEDIVDEHKNRICRGCGVACETGAKSKLEGQTLHYYCLECETMQQSATKIGKDQWIKRLRGLMESKRQTEFGSDNADYDEEYGYQISM